MRVFALIMALILSQSGFAATAELSKYYTLETIPLPEGESSADGLAFMPDGRLAACMSLSKIYMYDGQKWTLFADGLHTPLGILPAGKHEIIIAQRPELTLLKDTDHDGKADLYQTITDEFGMSGNYGEWCFGPTKDATGNLFFGLGTGSMSGKVLTQEVRGQYSPIGHQGRMNSTVAYRGWIMRQTKNGVTEPWASGLREPNGLGFDLLGHLYATDNQGDFLGSSKLYHIQKGHFYGHAPSLVWRKGFHGVPLDTPIEELDRMRTPAAIVFPHGDMANSPSQPLCDTSEGAFGPFAGQLFVGEMNRPRIMRCMLEEVDGQMQGACIPFYNHAGLQIGNNRLALDPTGNSLWVGQTLHTEWSGASGLQRISWTGRTPFSVKKMNLTDNGFTLTFTKPVDKALAANPETYSFKRYFYNYQGLYGSKKFDNTPVPVEHARVSDDGMTVTVELPLTAWQLYDLTIQGLTTVDHEPLMNNWMAYTLNLFHKNTPARPAPRPFKKPVWRKPVLPGGEVRSVGGPMPKVFIDVQTEPSTSTVQDVKSPTGAWKIKQSHGQVIIEHNNNECLRYQLTPLTNPKGGPNFKASNFIHPLRTPSGFTVTSLQPDDHLHHLGLWWPWKFLESGGRKINCWELQKKDGLVQGQKLITHKDGKSARFTSQSHYIDRKAPGGPTTILTEILNAEIQSVSTGPQGAYQLDLDILHTSATGSVKVADYRYSGFAYRGTAEWNTDNSTMETSAGKHRDDSNGTPAQWVRMEGLTGAKTHGGMLLMSHPSNPHSPENLRTWNASMHHGAFFVNFNTVQTTPLVIDPQHPCRRRFRILLYDGKLSGQEAQDAQKRFDATP